MRRKLISTLLGLAFMPIPIAVQSQTVSYAYDSSGNRIKREIRLNAKNKPGKSDVNEVHVQETLSDHNIRIYSNPTKGNLKIEIAGYTHNDTGKISLFNLSGQQLLSTPVNSTDIYLDINDRTNGIYILHISINGLSSSWKIIKE